MGALGKPVFRALWIAQFASNVGTWMQTVGAQWLLIDTSPLLVSLVQAASSLPIVLLALPAGAWADMVDRRRLLLGAQLAMFLAAAALAITTFAGHGIPGADLDADLRVGCGNAVAGPSWQAISPIWSIVACCPGGGAERAEHERARAMGPAVGGRVVAVAGAGWVFALNAASFVGIAIVLAMWRPAEAGRHAPGKTGGGAAGGGPVRRHALIVRRLLYRAVLFIPAASAVWALLPVVAADDLGLGSGGYGLLLGMVGRCRRGSGGDPTAPGQGRLGPFGHRAMVVTAVATVVVATVAARCWSVSPCCRSGGPGSR